MTDATWLHRLTSGEPIDLISIIIQMKQTYILHTQLFSRIKIAVKSANWVSLPRINFRAKIFLHVWFEFYRQQKSRDYHRRWLRFSREVRLLNLFGDFAVLIQLILLHTGLYSIIWIVQWSMRMVLFGNCCFQVILTPCSLHAYRLSTRVMLHVCV
jgi:hypothetical protein